MTDSQIIRKLHAEKKKVYIYGNANHASVVYDYLVKNGIDVEAFIVDKQYYTKGRKIKGKNIYCIDEIEEKLNNANIVLGFCNVEKTRSILFDSSNSNINYYCLWEPVAIYEWNDE